MKQGFEVNFYGKIAFKKDYEKVSRCVISAFHYGYVNVTLIAFGDKKDMLSPLKDDDWVQGTGKLSTNEYNGEKTLQIVLEDLILADAPEKNKKGDKESRYLKTKQNTEPDIDNSNNLIDDEDLPF
mgnify:CR=1 FL=1